MARFMTSFTVTTGAVPAWNRRGFADGRKGVFNPPAETAGKALQEAYRKGYWAGRRQLRKA